VVLFAVPEARRAVGTVPLARLDAFRSERDEPFALMPVLLMVRTCVPPAETPTVSAEGKKMPVFVSPSLVIEGVDALPSANSTVEIGRAHV
jgi:hypothetical protein